MLHAKLTRLQQLLSERRGIEVIDSHTCGQPTRVILSGTGLGDGMTPTEGREYLKNEADWVRRLAILEPRGHRSMFGAAIIYPSKPEDPYGVVFMDVEKYPDMCGHATIGAATTLVELGLVGPLSNGSLGCKESNRKFIFRLNTPAGELELEATIKNGHCHAVAFQTPLAYYVGSEEFTLASGRKARVDVAWGGQYYAFLPSDAVDLEIVPNSIDQLIAAATLVRALLAERFKTLDARTGNVPLIGNIVWTSRPRGGEAHSRNVPISNSSSFDRSPCGTATCARMAVLHARNELAVGEEFINESILGTLYYGLVISDTSQDASHSITPRVQGSAWITASSHLTVDPTDALARGYLIGGGAAVQ